MYEKSVVRKVTLFDLLEKFRNFVARIVRFIRSSLCLQN